MILFEVGNEGITISLLIVRHGPNSGPVQAQYGIFTGFTRYTVTCRWEPAPG